MKLQRDNSVLYKVNKPDAAKSALYWLKSELTDHQNLHIEVIEYGGSKIELTHTSDLKRKLKIPRDLLSLKPSVARAIYRKLLVKLRLSHDPVPMTHSDVLRHIHQLLSSVVKKVPAASSFLLRVDDFPAHRGTLSEFREFHKITKKYRIPYALGVTPYLNPEGLTDREWATLAEIKNEDVEPALHGFKHQRVSFADGEFNGWSALKLEEQILKAKADLAQHALEPSVFIAPYNRYEKSTMDVLSKHFPIICGGPESTFDLGLRCGPSVLEESLYLPSYRHLYDVSDHDIDRLEKVRTLGEGLILPITLHWAVEKKDQFKRFRNLCEALQGKTQSWSRVLKDYKEFKSWAF